MGGWGLHRCQCVGHAFIRPQILPSEKQTTCHESGHRRHGVCIAIECSYKLNQKNEFKFLCELCTFLQTRSHLLKAILKSY